MVKFLAIWALLSVLVAVAGYVMGDQAVRGIAAGMGLTVLAVFAFCYIDSR